MEAKGESASQNKCLFCGRFCRHKFCSESHKNKYHAKQRLIKKLKKGE